jgi:cytochrome c2
MRKSVLLAAASGLLVFSALGMAQKKGDAAKGKEVYEQCGVCHSADTDEKKMGPSLKGLFKKEKMANGQKPTDASVLSIVNKGKGSMPAFADVLSDDEKADLLAYLKTI